METREYYCSHLNVKLLTDYTFCSQILGQKRHKSRRLLSLENIEFFSKTLKSKGAICIATDVEDYYLEIENAFSNLYQFKKLHVSPKEKNLSFF